MAERTVRPRIPDSKWAAPRLDKSAAAVARAKARQDLAATLSDFIHQSGGWVVSAPGSELEVEVAQGSPLPSKLAELGYAIVHCGTGERIMSGARIEVVVERGKQAVRRHAAIVPVDILEIALPGA